MSLIARPRWTRQPQGAVEVDWSNPLTRGLVICTHAGNNFREMVTNKPSTITSATSAPTKEGRALMDSASTFSIETLISTDFGDAVTWFFLARPDGTGGGGLGRFIDKRTAAVNTQVEVLYFNGALGQLFFDRISAGGVNQSIYTTTSGMVAGNTYAVAARVGAFTSNADAALFVNGISRTLSTNTAGTVARATNAANYVLGNRTNDNARNFDGRMYCVYRWKRALSDGEIVSLSANPWQIFKPVTRTIGAVISGVTISRPSSDVTTTGWTASSGSVLYDMIDEVTPSDTDYIISPAINSTPGPAVFGITPTQASGTYNVRLRAKRTGATGDIRALLLDSGGATVGTSSWQALTASFAQYTLSVTTTGTAARVQLEVRP